MEQASKQARNRLNRQHVDLLHLAAHHPSIHPHTTTHLPNPPPPPRPPSTAAGSRYLEVFRLLPTSLLPWNLVSLLNLNLHYKFTPTQPPRDLVMDVLAPPPATTPAGLELIERDEAGNITAVFTEHAAGGPFSVVVSTFVSDQLVA